MVARALIIFNLLQWFCTTNVQAESGKFDVNPELFPVPENLVPSVYFWIDVFTKYNSYQVLIHDSQDLRIIYEVVDFKLLYGDSIEITRKHWRKIDLIRDKYRMLLKKLAAIKPINIKKLSPEELRVYNLFKEQTPVRLQRASDHIRTQKGLCDTYLEGLIRSGLYIDEMRRIFQKHGLPEDIVYLPHVESAFNIRTYSRVGAAGMWQFTRRTGRRFVKINYEIDERFDPFYSTEAAAQLLKENYQELGSWPLAITAYNHGQNGMRRAIKICDTYDLGVIIQKYKSRSFRFASKNFYAEFIAAVHVRKNYINYFGDIELSAPQKFTYFDVPHSIDIKQLSGKLNLDIEQIKSYNPSLRKPVLRSQKRIPRQFRLRIPWRGDEDVKTLYAEISDIEKHQKQLSPEWYQVQPGDNLETVAKKANLPMDSLLAYNALQNPDQIYIGEVLRISRDYETSDAIVKSIPHQDSARLQINLPDKSVTVQEKVDHSEITQNSKDQLMKSETDKTTQTIANNLSLNDLSQPENTEQPEALGDDGVDFANTKIEPAGPVQVPHQSSLESFADEIDLIRPATHHEHVVVQPDETLGHFADWLEIPTRILRKINGLRYGQDIQIGEKIKLTFTNISWQEFQHRRMEYHKSIEEDFFDNFKIENVQIHQIKYGENIWYLCNQVYEIPYWLILKYNAHIDLQKLRVGDEIIIPIVTSVNFMNTNGDINGKEKS